MCKQVCYASLWYTRGHKLDIHKENCTGSSLHQVLAEVKKAIAAKDNINSEEFNFEEFEMTNTGTTDTGTNAVLCTEEREIYTETYG